jgi:hypothetical protein
MPHEASGSAQHGGRYYMIVTGALCVWNERPEDLDRCVRGLGDIADRVVALDGAYQRYPTATAHSPEDQLDAIRSAAAAVNIDCLIIQPDRLWAGQVEKRCHLLAAAGVGSDWIVTLDADHVIRADREEARLILRRTPSLVFSVPYVTPINPTRSMEESAVGLWHQNQVGEPQFIPHIWRALPGMKVERFHWWYSAIHAGSKVWLWGGDGSAPSIDHQRIRRGYTVEHRTMMRTEEQIRISRAFLNDRDKVVQLTGQEDNQPGLFQPEYDYAWVPTR